jgi:hypothetical protein
VRACVCGQRKRKHDIPLSRHAHIPTHTHDTHIHTHALYTHALYTHTRHTHTHASTDRPTDTPRGVHTNKSFIMNLLSHPEFVDGQVDTGFIARNPDLLQPVRSSNRCVTRAAAVACVCLLWVCGGWGDASV